MLYLLLTSNVGDTNYVVRCEGEGGTNVFKVQNIQHYGSSIYELI